MSTLTMAAFDVVWIVCFSVILSAVYGSVDDMQQDEIEPNTFDVKPGAGRQEFARQWVCYSVCHETPHRTHHPHTKSGMPENRRTP